MKHMLRLLTVVLLLASSATGVLAQSSPPPNPNYTRFNTKADGDIPTPATSVVYLFFNGTNFRFKTAAGAFTDVGGGVSTAGGSGTAGVIPQFESASSVSNSVISAAAASGSANRGVVTIYDPDPTHGETRLVIREGTDLGGFENLFEIANNAGTAQWYIGGANNSFTTYLPSSGLLDAAERYFRINASGYAAPSDGKFGFHSSTNTYAGFDITIQRHSAGVLKVADGTTGFASLRAGYVGVETAEGAISNIRTISEPVTLNTGGPTTDTAADLCPANSIILAVTWRITADITGIDSTTLSVGDPTTPARFGTGTVFTAGTTGIGITHMSGASVLAATGPTQGTAAKLRFTLSGGATDDTPAAGAIRVTVTYLALTPPTS